MPALPGRPSVCLLRHALARAGFSDRGHLKEALHPAYLRTVEGFLIGADRSCRRGFQAPPALLSFRAHARVISAPEAMANRPQLNLSRIDAKGTWWPAIRGSGQGLCLV